MNKNMYGVEWHNENGEAQWREAQYIADLFEVVRELLGSGVRMMTVCRLITKE